MPNLAMHGGTPTKTKPFPVWPIYDDVERQALNDVHMGGRPADLDQLTAVAEKYGIALLEDAAHAHGSEWRGRKVGTFGIGGTFSFQASKTMTAATGTAASSIAF